MRMLVMTAVATALLTMPVQAQLAPGQTPGQGAPWATLPKMDNSAWEDQQQPAKKVDEGAYKSALDRIPPPKQANDPWGNVREKPQSTNSR